MQQICYNARETGMIDDPRLDYSNFACPLMRSRGGKRVNEPRVCGNCFWYSVQNGETPPDPEDEEETELEPEEIEQELKEAKK